MNPNTMPTYNPNCESCNRHNIPFSVEDGLAVQEQQLKCWSAFLKPSVQAELERLVKLQNNNLTCGHDVCRGTNIERILLNDVCPVI